MSARKTEDASIVKITRVILLQMLADAGSVGMLEPRKS
jgi:hypothetical protein